MKKWLFLLALFPSMVYAQDATVDAEHFKKMVLILQQQRNNALDALVVADTRSAELQEELDKAKAHIKELESKGKSDGGK